MQAGVKVVARAVAAFLAVLLALAALSRPPAAMSPTYQPLPGADVTATIEGFRSYSSITDENGTYKVAFYENGTCTVEASAVGYVTNSVSGITVTVGSEVSVPDIALDRSPVVSGSVTTPDGEPVGGALVLVVDQRGETVASAFTGSDGKYVAYVDGLTGTYSITVVPGFLLQPFWLEMEQAVSVVFGTPVFPVHVPGFMNKTVSGVQLTAGQLTVVDVTLDQRSAAVSGTVTDSAGNPVPGVIVIVVSSDGAVSAFAITDESGRYLVADCLPSGTYNVSVVITPGKRYVPPDKQVISLTAGTLMADINFQLARSATIFGVVTDSLGAPVAGAVVTAISSDGRYWATAMTNATGHYRIDYGLGGGTYNVTASSLWVMGNATGVVVAEGGEARADITMPLAQATVRGTVRDSSGNPLPGVSVKVEVLLPFVGAQTLGATATDDSGAYELVFFLPPGIQSVDITASKEGYVESTQTVQVQPGQIVEGVDFALREAASGVLAGRVIGEYVPSLVGPAREQRFKVVWDGQEFYLSVKTNSLLALPGYGLLFNQTGKSIVVAVSGPSNTEGNLTITIPKALLNGPWIVRVDGQQTDAQITANATHTTIVVAYQHSERLIEFIGAEVIPEYPLPALAVAALVVGLGAAAAIARLRGRAEAA